MSTARVTWHKPTASGNRTGWARIVTGVTEVRGAKGFVGEYLESGVETDIEVGALVLEVRPVGSVKNGSEMARLLCVTHEGELDEVIGDHDWRRQFLTFRDAVRAELERDRQERADDAAAALEGVSTPDLVAEVHRRGAIAADDLDMLDAALAEIVTAVDECRRNLELGEAFPVSETLGQVVTALEECRKGLGRARVQP